MQYHIQTLVKHLFDKDSFEQVTEQELKQFTDDYPYAAVGQFLYAKKLKDNGSYNHHDQGEQASLYFHNALWLRWQLEQKEEDPVLPVKAAESNQQPGFRIVVQMPKTESADITDQPEETKEEGSALPAAETTPETAITEQTIQPAAEQTTAPAPEEALTAEQEKSLQVNENGSLVEQAAVAEQTADTTASAVAIAETSQLAEESPAAETAVNAVSITEEALIPAAAVNAEVEANKEVDEIVPAVEITHAELETTVLEDDIVPAVDVTKVELEVTAIPDDIIPAVEVAPEELAAIAPVAAVEQVEVKANTMETAQAPAEIAIEEQLVAATTDIIPAEEPVAIMTKPTGFTPASQEGSMTVDLGEPIFESYHTIDYFASQGIKLMQEELKDKLGKQLKSFTDWLRSMKRVGPVESTSLDEITNQSIQRIAEHSIEEKEVLTEAMAEVWAKQGNNAKAIRVYEKLSLLNPAKTPYFAGRIEKLKAQ